MNIDTILEILMTIGCLMSFAGFIIPFLEKKGVNAEKIIDTAEQVENVAGEGINIAKSIFSDNKIVNAMDMVEKVAVKYTKNAEQLYQSNKLSKDARNAVVKQQVSNILKDLGIEETDAVKEFVDATLNEVCFMLPHQSEQDKTLQAQLQQSNVQLQVQVQDLQQSNAQLQSKLNNVQQVVQA
jgi:antitoxin component of RelBE/YafQ-DinJ toxin-antitoxin module